MVACEAAIPRRKMCDYGMVLFLSRVVLRRIGHGNTRWSFIEMASAKHAGNRLEGLKEDLDKFTGVKQPCIE